MRFQWWTEPSWIAFLGSFFQVQPAKMEILFQRLLVEANNQLENRQKSNFNKL